MNIPIFSEQNFAMHLLGASFVELFPNLQLLDLSVYPDRFCIDFSFSRSLSIEEVTLLKNRFFEKMKGSDRGQVREMVSKNACDLLKHHKQIFLTSLVDKEEQFTKMLCMEVYESPLFGEIDLNCQNINELTLKMYDLDKKKWDGKKIHHYQMEGFIYYSKEDKLLFEKLLEKVELDHLYIGEKNGLFWVEDGLVLFSAKGEALFQKLNTKVGDFFGERVYFETSSEHFSKISGIKDFFILDQKEGSYDGIDYGLKETEMMRILLGFTFSKKDLIKKFEELVKDLGLNGKIEKEDKYLVSDFKGISWIIAEILKESSGYFIEINTQRLFALLVESKNFV